jgi:hypothetical protein
MVIRRVVVRSSNPAAEASSIAHTRRQRDIPPLNWQRDQGTGGGADEPADELLTF